MLIGILLNLPSPNLPSCDKALGDGYKLLKFLELISSARVNQEGAADFFHFPPNYGVIACIGPI